MNIEDLELTVRSLQALKRAGIDTVEQFLGTPYLHVAKIKGIGKSGISEVYSSCIHLQSGKMLDERVKWDKEYPGRPGNYGEIIKKSKKYDEIVKILGA